MWTVFRWIRRGTGLAILLLAGPALATVSGLADLRADWRTASREPMGIAPDPAAVREPVVQVYAARTFGWRGAFAVHTWISAKRQDAASFTSYEVIGWRLGPGRSALSVRNNEPDRRWYGAEPKILLDLRGPEVEPMIDKIEAAVKSYPYPNTYNAWPGPNSNTFTAWVGRNVPDLRLDLPPTAVGKDFLGTDQFTARAPSGSGFQVSVFGVLGFLAAVEEGLEFNVLGLSFGIDPLDMALRLPGLGRVP